MISDCVRQDAHGPLKSEKVHHLLLKLLPCALIAIEPVRKTRTGSVRNQRLFGEIHDEIKGVEISWSKRFTPATSSHYHILPFPA